MMNDLAVIVRSAGERTKEACLNILGDEVPSERIVVIEEKPFNLAVKKSFEIGMDYALTWTLCVDADLLLFHGAIAAMVNEALRHPEETFGITGYVWDKFYGGRKKGGPHLYKTKLLSKAIKHVPDMKESLRPETYVKDAMSEQGNVWPECTTMFALHDYEQYYTDIFRKLVVRTNKSAEATNSLYTRAERMSKIDKDFLFALWGIRYGRGLDSTEIELHSEQWRKQTEILMVCNDLKEKGTLDLSWARKLVQSISVNSNLVIKQEENISVSPISRMIWSTGTVFSKVGSVLQNRATSLIKSN